MKPHVTQSYIWTPLHHILPLQGSLKHLKRSLPHPPLLQEIYFYFRLSIRTSNGQKFEERLYKVPEAELISDSPR